MNKLSVLLLLIIYTFIFTGCSLFESSSESEYTRISNQICSAINQPEDLKYHELFHSSFTKAVPEKTILTIFQSIKSEYGDCSKILITEYNDNHSGEFFTIHNMSIRLSFSMTIGVDKNKPYIYGLLFKGKEIPSKKIQSETELYNYLKSSNSNMTILLRKFKGSDLLSYNEINKRALGSIFKLYVLGALEEVIKTDSKITWDTKIEIKNKLKSLSSGEMHLHKEGDKFSLYEFAAKMISISDNTATDHLIEFIGRSFIQDYIKKNKLNSFPNENIPFLKTYELFKMKAYFSKDHVKSYKLSSEFERLKAINQLPKINPNELLELLGTWKSPREINSLEWFASPNDICNVFKKLYSYNDIKLSEILGLNTPLVNTKSHHWSYIGYKGGSEPGVLELAYYLINEKKEEYCLYIGNNNLKENINEQESFSFIKGLFQFIEDKNY